jgi:hypothetical protein
MKPIEKCSGRGFDPRQVHHKKVNMSSDTRFVIILAICLMWAYTVAFL